MSVGDYCEANDNMNLDSKTAQTNAEQLVTELLRSVGEDCDNSKVHKSLVGFILSLLNRHWSFSSSLKSVSRPIYLKYKKTIENYS